MKLIRCVLSVMLFIATAIAREETGVKARRMLAMGDESILFARSLLRREQAIP